MLQLMEIIETDIDEILNQTFILSFENENLPEKIWFLLKNDSRIHWIVIILIIHLYPSNRITTNEEVDNTLKELKNNFLEYYIELTKRMRLVPVSAS